MFLSLSDKNILFVKKSSKFHPRNKHQGRYDFPALVNVLPGLKEKLNVTPRGEASINFHDSESVKALNKALLIHSYNLKYWDIPDGFLCPPVPSRSDYIHYIADELIKINQGKNPRNIIALDIGTGANLIYPIIGTKEYNWNFIASDIDNNSIANVKEIISENDLDKKIITRIQKNKNHIFQGIIQEDEYMDITICNPPFHASAADAEKGTQRKLKNILKNKSQKLNLNFSGKSNELWYEGGEINFIKKMILESELFKNQVLLFSSLISKEKNIKPLILLLEKSKASMMKLIPLHHGNKKIRILLWSFMNNKQMDAWRKFRWK